MSSSLDKQLLEYQTRPKDESGATRTKQSLIFDPKKASFVDSDTFYQIGFQGFSELMKRDDRIVKFESSIFAYNNSQIDPLFLTAEENQKIFDQVEELLFLLSDYILFPETVQILEYLIQQFAVNRLRPAHLILILIPYMETSFFVRVLQTIPFKSLPHEFKMLKPFSMVASSKKPISRKILKDWIESRPVLMQWLLSSANNIIDLHPKGVFASFLGVLFTELAVDSSNEIVLRAIVDSCKLSLNSNSPYLALQTLIAVATINEKKELSRSILKSLANSIYNNYKLLEESYNSYLLSAMYFSTRSGALPSVEFIIALSYDIQKLNVIAKQFNIDQFAENCIKRIISNLSNENLLRSVIAILETDFFDSVSSSLLLQTAQNFDKSDLCKEFIEAIASHYPNAISTEVISCLEKENIKFTPSQISPHNLVKQLSDPDCMASLFSNPDLSYDIASKQVVQALMSAEAAGVTEPIVPIITFFKGRSPNELIEYLTKNIFVTEKPFSISLNNALNKYGDGIAPFFKDIPSSNSQIIQHLMKQELPDYNVLPLAIIKAMKTNNCIGLFEFLPKSNMDFADVIEKMETLEKTKDISFETIEAKTALILTVIKEISANNELSINEISLLFDFPSLKCIASIVKNIKNRSSIYKVFEQSEPDQKRLRTNILFYINAIISKVDDITELLPIIFIGFLYPEHVDQSIAILRSAPLKNKDIKNVITTILRQSQFFKSDQNSLRTVFRTISSNEKNRDLFDKLWKNINLSKGLLSFWKLTNDSGVSTVIKSFINTDEIPQIVSEFLSLYPNNDEIKEIGIKSMNSHLLRAVLPYLSIDLLSNILTPVCCFPKFYSNAFTDFFLKQTFDASILLKIFRSNEKIRIITNPPLEPPKIFQSFSGMKNEYAILPTSLIMELIPLSKQITNIEVLIPEFLEILKTKRQQNLVFPCLFKCIDKSADLLLENFSIIINSIADSQNPHINSSALKLIQILTNKSPKIVAQYSQALFTSLSSSTLFSDDTSNLIKIKQLLSSILPILTKTNEVNELINFFSENINNFSIDRASQLMIHSIQVLGNDSYKIFQSLLKFNRMDFAHLLIDQLEPQQLMTALIKLLETDVDCVQFIIEIQLPPLPKQLLSLFELLSKKIDISDFIQSTCDSFGINDFVNLMCSLIKSELNIYPIFHKRIEADPSSLFVNLLVPLQSEIKEFKSLESNLLMLSEIANCIEQKDTSKLIEVIKIMLDGVETDSYTLPNKVQALCFFATSIERFNLVLYEVFPRVIDFASNLYSFIVHESIEALLSSTTASVCLLLKTSPSFCIEKLPQIWSDFLSTIVLDNLSDMVETSFMIITKVTSIDALIRPFLIAYKKNTTNPNALIILFKALQNCIANSDKDYFEDNHQRICKFFLLAFSNKYQDWDTMIQIQDAIILAFCTFLTQLNENLMSINLHQFMTLFEQIMEEGQSDYMINRLFYVRTLNAIFKGLGKTISKYYGSILPTIITFLNSNDDSIFNERQLTIESLELIQTITQFADDGFFDADQFNSVLKAIISHANKVVLTDPQEFFSLIILHVAPTFAALMDSTKDDMLWRSANLMLIDMMRSDETKVKIAALKICDEEFKVVGSEFTTILAELLPSLSECAEYSKDAVDTIARETIQSIENSIGEPIDSYFT